MKASKIRLTRRYIRFRRWRRSLFTPNERLSAVQEAGLSLFNNAVEDKDKSRLDFCPVTSKRFVTRGTDVIIIYGSCLTFVGQHYYYVLQYQQGTYGDIAEHFDDELSKRLSGKHRRILGDVKTQVGEILAKAESNSVTATDQK